MNAEELLAEAYLCSNDPEEANVILEALVKIKSMATVRQALIESEKVIAVSRRRRKPAPAWAWAVQTAKAKPEDCDKLTAWLDKQPATKVSDAKRQMAKVAIKNLQK